jgi:hypothetical protein
LTTVVSAASGPTRADSASLAKMISGATSATVARKASTPVCSIAAVEDRSTLTRGARLAAARAVSRSGGRTRL